MHVFLHFINIEIINIRNKLDSLFWLAKPWTMKVLEPTSRDWIQCYITRGHTWPTISRTYATGSIWRVSCICRRSPQKRTRPWSVRVWWRENWRPQWRRVWPIWRWTSWSRVWFCAPRVAYARSRPRCGRSISGGRATGIIKWRVNSNINCVLISVFFYLF